MTLTHRKQMQALLRSRRQPSTRAQGSPWAAAILASIVTFLITVSGFGISVFGFWKGLKYTDDLRVLVTSSPPLITIDQHSIAFMQPIDLTYINSGNREARISHLGLVALKYDEAKPPTDQSCEEGEPEVKIYPRFKFSSAIVEPGRIMEVHPPKYEAGMSGRDLGEQGIVFDNLFRLAANEWMLVCLQQRIITPDSYVASSSKMLWLLKPAGDWKRLFDESRPMVVKQSTSYFD